jgi:hypothetical protein
MAASTMPMNTFPGARLSTSALRLVLVSKTLAYREIDFLQFTLEPARFPNSMVEHFLAKPVGSVQGILMPFAPRSLELP